MKSSRRAVVVALVPLLLSPSLSAQLLPTYLRLMRRTGWEELMGRNKCVIGDLFKSAAGFPISDPGLKICNVLELAYRHNQSEISAVPKGDYEGFVRSDGSRGWRIELKGTAPRENIQIHVGNRPSDTIGCLLPGTGESSDSSCIVAGSSNAMADLKLIVGSSPVAKILLRVE